MKLVWRLQDTVELPPLAPEPEPPQPPVEEGETEAVEGDPEAPGFFELDAGAEICGFGYGEQSTELFQVVSELAETTDLTESTVMFSPWLEGSSTG